MGFGINISAKVEVPKVEVPKVQVPKIDVGAAVSGAASAAAGAVASATAAVAAVATGIAGALSAPAQAAAGAAASLSSVPGALLDVDVSFTGATSDFVMEPHSVLAGNADHEETQFNAGPVWITMDLTKDEADDSEDTLHLFSASGDYDEKVDVSDYTSAGEESVDILFEDAPMSQTFSLEVIPDEGEARLIFSGIAYGDLCTNRWSY